MLLGFNAADFGRTTDGWSDAQIVDSAVNTLQTIFGNDIPAPTDSQVTRWASDPYAPGSYSFNKLERPYRVPGGPLGLSLVTLSLTDVCAWAAWQQCAENGTRAVTYCLVAVGACALLYLPLARRRHLEGTRTGRASIPCQALLHAAPS